MHMHNQSRIYGEHTSVRRADPAITWSANYIYIYIYICTYIHTYVYSIYIPIWMCVCVCIYIYTHTHLKGRFATERERERDKERDRQRERGRLVGKIRVLQHVFRIQVHAAEKTKVKHYTQILFNRSTQWDWISQEAEYYFLLGK